MNPGVITISLLAIPETYMSCLSGLYDILTVSTEVLPGRVPLQVEIVAETDQLTIGKNQMPVIAHRQIQQVSSTDVVIVPTSVVGEAQWETGRYPEVVRWLQHLYGQGAVLCSTCSGVLLLAETGLLNGKEATTHWAIEETMRTNFPVCGAGAPDPVDAE